MTPDELHTAALTAIAERRALAAAGTARPWRVVGDGDEYLNRTDIVDDAEPGRRVVVCKHAGFDAALIVAAVNAFDRDTDALESVVERHAPILGGWCRAYHAEPTRWLDCPEVKPALRALGVLDD